MKTLLIPALALILASLPAPAQKTAEPAAPTPPPAVALPAVPAISPTLLRKVQFDDATLSEVIASLNAKLAEQKGESLNVVISAGLETTKVPTVLLQNVTAADVLNVVAKMIDLTVEPVPSDSGKVAAWIITKAKPVARKKSVELTGAGGGADLGGAGGAGDALIAKALLARVPFSGIQPLPLPNDTSRLEGAMPGGAGGSMGKGSADVFWIDPASPQPPPAQICRVVGIGKIFEDSFTPEDRTRLEFDLADRLSVMARDQKMECQVKFYESLRVIVLKGTPEGVALIEQTVAAMKENAGGKKPAAVTAPPKF